jgi:hypothetical protein
MRNAWIGLVAGLVGCTGGGDGTVALKGWGEEAPYEGFPNSELSFIDGWSLQFVHSVTSFGNFELADPDTEEAVATDATNYVADWTQTTDPADVNALDVPEGRYKYSFSFIPLTDGATAVGGDVDAAVLSAMVTNGWNTYLDGVATKGSVTVTFKWGMANAARYKFCVNGEDDTDGVAVSAGETTDATMFVHQDHTFWDRLGTEEANLRFDTPAAWADTTGEIPLDDLSQVSTAAPEDRDGNPILDQNGNPLAYDDGGLGLADLKAFILYSTAQQGHLNGEGLCTITDL